MILPEAPVPDLIIFLHSKIDSTLKLNEGLNDYFYTYERAPIFIINADHVDFVEDRSFELICQMLEDFKGKRKFYNTNIGR